METNAQSSLQQNGGGGKKRGGKKKIASEPLKGEILVGCGSPEIKKGVCENRKSRGQPPKPPELDRAELQENHGGDASPLAKSKTPCSSGKEQGPVMGNRLGEHSGIREKRNPLGTHGGYWRNCGLGKGWGHPQEKKKITPKKTHEESPKRE